MEIEYTTEQNIIVNNLMDYNDTVCVNTIDNGTNNAASLLPKNLEIPLYIYICVSVVNAIIFIVGTFGNVLVIVVVLRVREMRTPTNVFLLNLSVADVMVLIVCQPAALLEFYGKERWFLGEVMCKLIPLMENGVLHVSILTMLAVTLERYNALCHPFRRRMSYSISSTFKSLIVIWIVGWALASPFAMMTDVQDAKFHDGTPIHVCRTKIHDKLRHSYIVLVFVLFFVLPLIMVVVFYTRIIRQLMSDTLMTLTENDTSAANTLKARKQAVYMLIFIIVLFFVSLFPIRVLTLWLIFSPTSWIHSLGLETYINIISWARVLMYVNSAGNPIIYGLTSTKFKAAFKKVLLVKGTTPRGGTYSTARNHFNDAGRSRIPLTPVITQKYDREDEGEPYFLVRIVLGRRSRTVRHDRSGHLKVIDENGVETGRISVDSPM